MLSLLFKKPLTDEEDEHLFRKFTEYPKKYEHDISHDIDTKMSIYIGDWDVAQKYMDELKAEGLNFIGQIHHGRPFFHEKFVMGKDWGASEASGENSENVSLAKQNVDPVTPERNSTVPFTTDSATPVTPTELSASQYVTKAKQNEDPVTPERNSTIPFTTNSATLVTPTELSTSQYVTKDEFEAMKQKAQEQLNEFSVNLMSKVDAISASTALASAFAHDFSSSPSTVGPSSSTVSPSSLTTPVKPEPISAQFKAKNELIANGIPCEKCGETVREVEPITKLIMSVREHVITHFDSENPRLKRFECRECPGFRTNFVDDFERHLRRHGSMSSLSERRQKLTVNLLTSTHLKLISKLSHECFPKVFEKSTPQLNTILAVDTPHRAKVSVFPRLDRLYCSKYNIPFASNCHSSLPTTSLKID